MTKEQAIANIKEIKKHIRSKSKKELNMPSAQRRHQSIEEMEAGLERMREMKHKKQNGAKQ